MQAGLTTSRVTFREIFSATTIHLWSRVEMCTRTTARRRVATLDGGSTLREQILDISKAYAESMVEPDGVADDFGRKSISAVARRLALHSPILSVTRST